MATFKIERIDKLYGYWYIDAETQQEAEDKWDEMLNNGEVDFSDMEIIDSDERIVRVVTNPDNPLLFEEIK